MNPAPSWPSFQSEGPRLHRAKTNRACLCCPNSSPTESVNIIKCFVFIPLWFRMACYAAEDKQNIVRAKRPADCLLVTKCLINSGFWRYYWQQSCPRVENKWLEAEKAERPAIGTLIQDDLRPSTWTVSLFRLQT